MSFWWIWGIYFMDHVVLRNDFGMDKKLGAVSGGLEIVRVMAAAWLISVMISAVGMVLASLISMQWVRVRTESVFRCTWWLYWRF